ncbi:MAG: sensor histidine kinase [Rhodothermales bacterium]|nr:sensor histidine kinase [Rhodothermales bacterium]
MLSRLAYSVVFATVFAFPGLAAAQVDAVEKPVESAIGSMSAEGVSISGVELEEHDMLSLEYEVGGVARSIKLPQQILEQLIAEIERTQMSVSGASPDQSPPDSGSKKRRLATPIVNGQVFTLEIYADSVVTIQYLEAGTTRSITVPFEVVYHAYRHHAALSTEGYPESEFYIEPASGKFWLTLSQGFNYKVVMLAFALVLAGFVFAVAHLSTRKLRRERDDLRASRRRMLRIREAERSHLASELHDGPVQDVQRILRSDLSSLARLIPTSESDDLAALESTLRQIAGNLRDICTDLKPPVLAHFGLEKAVESVVRAFHLRNPDVHVEQRLTLGPDELPEESRLVLYRVLQEALTNIEKHADAGDVRIYLTRQGDWVHLSVEDDGRGFRNNRRPAKLEETGHFGISGMRQRVESVGGTLHIDSAPGNGTRISVHVPTYVEEGMTMPLADRLR